MKTFLLKIARYFENTDFHDRLSAS